MQCLGNLGVKFLFIGWLTDWLVDGLVAATSEEIHETLYTSHHWLNTKIFGS